MLNSCALNNNLVTCGSTEKRHTDGGGVGDLTVLGIGLVGAYDVVGELLLSLNVVENYDRAYANLCLVDLRLVDNLCICDHLAELVDSGVDNCLLLLSCIVLTVLREVAVSSRLGNLLLILFNLYVDKLVELILKSLKALGGV